MEAFGQAFPFWIAGFLVLNAVWAPISLGLFVWLIVSFVGESGTGCDVPLRTWTIVEFVNTSFSLVHTLVFHYVCARADPYSDQPLPWYGKLYASLVCACEFIWFAIGLYWVNVTENCDEKSPKLYFTVKVYTAVCLAFTAIVALNAVGIYTVMSWMLRNGMLRSREAAPSGTLHKLRLLKFDADSEEFQAAPECSICLATFDDSKEVRVTQCGHLFHSRCLENWLKLRRACPLCRQDVTLGLEGGGARQGMLDHMLQTIIGQSSST